MLTATLVRFTKGAPSAMIRAMTRAGEPIGRRDAVIAVAFALLGLLLMYGNATDPVVDTGISSCRRSSS